MKYTAALFRQYRWSMLSAFIMTAMVFGLQARELAQSSMGQLLIGLFGGLEWSEEMMVNEIIMYVLRLVPVLFVLSAFLSDAMCTQGLVCYRLKNIRCWYRQFLQSMYSLLFAVWVLQVAAALLIGVLLHAQGWTACITDVEGYPIWCDHLVPYSVLLYLLKLMLLATVSQAVFLLFRKQEAFTLGFLLPEMLSIFAFSNPYSALGKNHLASMGMVKRILLEEGGIGIPLWDAIAALALSIVILVAISYFLSPSMGIRSTDGLR